MNNLFVIVQIGDIIFILSRLLIDNRRDQVGGGN